MIYDIVGPDGRVHYRRPYGHPDLDLKELREGYSIRLSDQQEIGYIPPDHYDDLCAYCGFRYGKHRSETVQCPTEMDSIGFSHSWKETVFKLKEQE